MPNHCIKKLLELLYPQIAREQREKVERTFFPDGDGDAHIPIEKKSLNNLSKIGCLRNSN
ncbi:hypothetical protein [Nostoc sp. MS1]|uniref:hypothetical protein n=1 Tax=Nostoc sp. MS1 TaxID=2764711 RepID=UPI001CC7A7A8|nr:hypothetical protein [Nostoc sp. MS1]